MPNSNRRIFRNRARCLKCQDVVESLHRHDMRWCACGSLGVDGGRDYARRIYDRIELFEDLCEYEEGGPTGQSEAHRLAS